MTYVKPSELTKRFEAGELNAMVFDKDEVGWFFITSLDSGKIRTPFKADKSAREVCEVYAKSDRVIGFKVSVFGSITSQMVENDGAKDILWNL